MLFVGKRAPLPHSCSKHELVSGDNGCRKHWVMVSNGIVEGCPYLDSLPLDGQCGFGQQAAALAGAG